MRPLPLAALGLLTACAPSLQLPAVAPDNRWADSTAGWTLPATFATASPYGYALRRDQDRARTSTRLAVTTHRGVYTGWVQRPQITFYAQFEGSTPRHAPATIALLFRTLEPEALSSTWLVLGCRGTADTVPVVPRSVAQRTGSTSSHFLTYHLPLAAVAHFAACTEASLAVGQLHEGFFPDQLGALQVLLRAVTPAPPTAGP